MKKLLLALILTAFTTATAQAAPPLTITIPFGAGGSSDSTARILVEYMKNDLDRRITIVNKPGASGTMGTTNFLKVRPDGRNALIIPSSVFVYPVLQGRTPIDPDNLISAGGYLASERILFARADAPYSTMDEMIEYARTNPGKLRFGTGGAADAGYVFRHILDKEDIDINVTHFNGGGDAAAAIMGGHVDLVEGGVGSPADVAAMAGRLTPIALLGSGKLEKYPNLKNPFEMGYEYAAENVFGIFFPKGTDQKHVDEITESLKRVLQEPELAEKFAARGAIPQFFTADEMRQSTNIALKIGELKALDD